MISKARAYARAWLCETLASAVMIAPDRQANNVVVSFVPMLKGVVLRCNVAQKRPPSMRTLAARGKKWVFSTTGCGECAKVELIK